jgi:hypothetical protein
VAILRAEANRIRRIYLELQQVYEMDVELTDVIDEMAKDLELDQDQE